jgi:hypothetical protein
VQNLQAIQDDQAGLQKSVMQSAFLFTPALGDTPVSMYMICATDGLSVHLSLSLSLYIYICIYVYIYIYIMTDGSNRPVSQLAGQSSEWPADDLQLYGKIMYSQMIGQRS